MVTNSVKKAIFLAELLARNSFFSESSQQLPAIKGVAVYFFESEPLKVFLHKCFNTNKFSGPNHIPALVLKQYLSTLARLLANLLSASYRASIFPIFLKGCYCKVSP